MFHAAMLSVKEYTSSSFLCKKVSTLVGDHCFSIAVAKGAQMRVCAFYDGFTQAFTQSIESKFVKVEDVSSWITIHSLESAMDGILLNQ